MFLISPNQAFGRGRRQRPAIDYSFLFNSSDSDSDRSFERYLENLKRYQDSVSGATGCVDTYRTVGRPRSSEINYCLKNRLMDLRKTTNHPYLIEYPLTEDGMFFKVDDSIVDVCGKLKVLGPDVGGAYTSRTQDITVLPDDQDAGHSWRLPAAPEYSIFKAGR